MTIAVMFDFSHVDLDVYDEVLEKTGTAIFDAPGLHHHVCFKDGTGFRVVDVWDDEATFGAFGDQVIGPALASLGVEGPPPAIFEVHNEPGSGNVATVAGIYAAFGRGDVPAIVDALADDVDWERGAVGDHGIPWLRAGRGKAHVGAFFESLAGLQITAFHPYSIVARGSDRVVALIDIEATVVATGKRFGGLEVHVWWFGSDGKATAFRHVVDTAEMAAAVSP